MSAKPMNTLAWSFALVMLGPPLGAQDRSTPVALADGSPILVGRC